MLRPWCALSWLALLCSCASVSAQSAGQAVPSFDSQPESIRRDVLLGEPRTSQHIPDSPFGIMTSICAEGGPAAYVQRAAGALAAAGYKWVGEYVAPSWHADQAPQLAEAATWSRLAPRCAEHLARLQASGISVMMRVDLLPARGSAPVTEQELALASAYARNVVAQLKPYVKRWQIGNEPNPAEASVRMREVVARAIRAEQPDASVDGPTVMSEHDEGSAISAGGEQRITPVIDAKNELRRALLDFSRGVYPRIHFALFRDIQDADFSHAGSFNLVDSQLNKKPLYYAAQNLHAVLDSTYSQTERIRVSLQVRAPVQPTDQVQTYLKHHAGFDELLIFFWATLPTQNTHLRAPLAIELRDAGWQAPVLVDLMTMPGRAKSIGHEPSTHQRTTFPSAHTTQTGVQVDGLELRDYPQLLKLIRPSRAAP